jgi:tripartite-type tricarboxylate transporter receptor subunit TctC
MPRLHHVAGILLSGFMVAGAQAAGTQTYPNKVIRIVTTTAGGGTDFMARLVSQGITEPLGQPVVIENRPAGFTPGLIVAQAAPDGYTLLVAGSNHHQSTLLKKAPYDAIKSFAPVSLLSLEPNVLTVYAGLPVTSVKELIALAKSKPGMLNYSSNGEGSSGHLGTELFSSMAGIKMTHIPYKGAAQATADQLTGQVHVRFGSLGPVVPHVKGGKLKALGVTTLKPSALLPGVPAVAATVPGYEYTSGAFIYAPAGTPAPVIKRLHEEIARALLLPAAKDKVFSSGQEIVAGSPQELGAYIKSEMQRLAKVIKDAGIKSEE